MYPSAPTSTTLTLFLIPLLVRVHGFDLQQAGLAFAICFSRAPRWAKVIARSAGPPTERACSSAAASGAAATASAASRLVAVQNPTEDLPGADEEVEVARRRLFERGERGREGGGVQRAARGAGAARRRCRCLSLQ